MKILPIACSVVLVATATFAAPSPAQQTQRSFVSAKFVSVGDKSITVEVTNKSGKDIQQIRGVYRFEDAQGQEFYISATTVATRHLFLKKDETKPTAVYVVPTTIVRSPGRYNGKPVAEVLKTLGDQVKVWFEAMEIVYGDGSKDEALEKLLPHGTPGILPVK